jgi:hypothetical protein
MKNLALGVIVGIAIALCGYKPYQIEMEYRDNISTGVVSRTHATCITGVEFVKAEFRGQ